MEPSSVRLIIEAVVLTVALIGAGGVSLWLFVQSRRRTPDALAELTASYDELARMVRALQRDRELDHRGLLKMQTRLEIQMAYSRALADYADRLADRLRSLGEQNIPAAPSPPVFEPEPIMARGVNTQLLAQAIAQHFNDEEIDDLMFRLAIADGEVPAGSLGRRTRALVLYMQRRERLDELIALCRALRPEGGF